MLLVYLILIECSMNKLAESTVPAAAWWSHIYAIAGQDMTLSKRAIPDAMLGSGFGSVESRYVEDCMGVDRVDIARK